jgi:hypothetical protein
VPLVKAFGEKSQLFTKINGHFSRFAVESQQFLISPFLFRDFCFTGVDQTENIGYD